VHAVGADDDARVFGHRLPAPLAAADSDHPAVVEEDLVDVEALADLGPRLGGGVDEELVQDNAPRA